MLPSDSYPQCKKYLQDQGILSYPRTCQECGLGPCKKYPAGWTEPPSDSELLAAANEKIASLTEELAKFRPPAKDPLDELVEKYYGSYTADMYGWRERVLHECEFRDSLDAASKITENKECSICNGTGKIHEACDQGHYGVTVACSCQGK